MIPVPDVRPADAAAPVIVGDQGPPVGPDVEEDLFHVRDAARGERLDDPWILPQRDVALVVLVDRYVGLLAGAVLPRDDAVLVERDYRLVGLAVVAVPADEQGFARNLASRSEHLLGWLLQLDSGEAPPLVEAPVLAQDGRSPAELLRGQRIERVTDRRWALRSALGLSHLSSPPSLDPPTGPLRSRARPCRA